MMRQKPTESTKGGSSRPGQRKSMSFRKFRTCSSREIQGQRDPPTEKKEEDKTKANEGMKKIKDQGHIMKFKGMQIEVFSKI